MISNAMKPAEEETVASSVIGPRAREWGAWQDWPRRQRLRIGGLVGYVGLVTLLFGQPLAKLFVHALQDDLHTYIPLVPLIAGYLLYVQGRRPPPATYRSSIVGTVLMGAFGVAALAVGIGWRSSLSANDYLALITLAYVSFVVASGFLFLGSRWMAVAAFPVAFLIFMVPLPDGAVHWLERASVLGSAEAAAFFFNLTDTPLMRDGTTFALPGIAIEVAQECSGIRSSWVLFITSLVASHLYLESPWRKLVLVAFVIPLGILRNGFRILVIGLLCVHVGPHMINSAIHEYGGPLFFALSLVPLIVLLSALRRHDKRANV